MLATPCEWPWISAGLKISSGWRRRRDRPWERSKSVLERIRQDRSTRSVPVSAPWEVSGAIGDRFVSSTA